MKKIKFFTIPVLAALLFAGCVSTPAEVNKAPSVTGVKDIQCMVNSTVDFLDGVAALDKEDGDITPKMQISVTPQVEVSADGYAYFSEVGEYTVSYTVADSEGRTAQKRAYVDVVDRETYKTFAMPEGFTAEANGEAKIEKCGMINREFVLEATGGEIAEDVKLTRTYSLNTKYAASLQYTFRYAVNSEKAGKVKVLADGYECAEVAVSEGDNVLSFAHTISKKDNADEVEVTIDVCPGSLGDVKWIVKGVELEYRQKAGELVELAEDFSFTGRVSPRIDTNGKDRGELPIAGNAWAEDGGDSARLEITSTTGIKGDIWRGGMFINTGINLRAGSDYTVAFDIESTEEEDYEIIIQRGQWDEYKFVTLGTEEHPIERGERVVYEISVNAQSAGALWLYVQSGHAVNRITLSGLSVKEKLNDIGTESFAIEDFTSEGGALSTENGNFGFLVKDFGDGSGANQVKSPSFLVAGSSGNYVITFRAKASAPVEMIFASPVYGGWDPTIVWERFNLSENETIYTFFCNGNASDRLYTLVWQFGSVSNQKYHDVKIEISDIRVSLKNNSLDG